MQAKLEQTDWDLVVVDEAHKMSAHFYGMEVQETKRYRLGRLLGSITRHLLLMTATPHRGKPEDFQLFMALIDPDRFEGQPRGGGAKQIDAQGLMRRMVKEELLTFEGNPLFPERRAYTVTYPLSTEEAPLYAEVTEYVREQMNRAEKLRAEGEGRRGALRVEPAARHRPIPCGNAPSPQVIEASPRSPKARRILLSSPSQSA